MFDRKTDRKSIDLFEQFLSKWAVCFKSEEKHQLLTS